MIPDAVQVHHRINTLMVTLETPKLIPEKDKIVQREVPAAHVTKVHKRQRDARNFLFWLDLFLGNTQQP
jgi:hypothetical protein